MNECAVCEELVTVTCSSCGGCRSCCECSGLDLDTTDPDEDGYLWNLEEV